MNKLYIKSTIRNARKNGVLSFAKLFSLTISFTVILFATGYVYFENSFDRFIPDHDRIYRCLMKGKLNNNDADFMVTSPEMAAVVVNDIPEVEEAVRFTSRGIGEVYYNNDLIIEEQLLYADSNFFSFFSLPVISTRDNVFQSATDIAISSSTAKKHFGSAEEALNKVVRLRGDDCLITAVFEDFPDNFHLQFNLIQSIEASNPEQVGWGSQNYATYIKTNTDNIDIDDLSFKLTKTVYTHWDNEIDGASAKTWDDLKYFESTYIFFPAEKLTDAHFSNHRFDPAQTSNRIYVYGAIILAILVFIISTVNYINLSVADLSTRFKEIGIHKTSGALSRQITGKFVFEGIIFWTLSFILAVILFDFIAKPLASFLEMEFTLARSTFAKLLGITFFILLLVNILTAIFPITQITRKKVLSLVKGENTGRVFSIKSSFIFFQFILSALIILSSLIVQKQINFMVNKDRGYDTENIITLNIWSLEEETRSVFIEELKEQSSILSVSSSDSYFGTDPGMTDGFFERQAPENYFHTSSIRVDYDFFETFNIELLEGRLFNKTYASDNEAVIVNESALHEGGASKSPIGSAVILGGDPNYLIGVVKDFNFRSLHHQLLPLTIRLGENYGNVFVKVRANQIPLALNQIEKQWHSFDISAPFEYEFHDEILARNYENDLQAKKLLLLLSLISITIACIGLYAVSFFIMTRKTKEIGIRKVNGALLNDILFLLNKDFLKWVFISFLVASPIAWFIMKRWLENFAYQTQLSWWLFAAAGFLSLSVAFFTLIWQSWRIASRNPVEALRYE